MKPVLCSLDDFNEAKLLSTKLKEKIFTIAIENFSGNEKLVSMVSNINNSSKLLIFKTLWPNPNDKILELLLILDYLKYNTKAEIELFIPYIPYLRQDRELKNHSAIGARMFFDIINFYNIKIIHTIDAHSHSSINFCNQKINNIDPSYYFSNKIKNILLNEELIYKETFVTSEKDKKNLKTIVIAPDEGSISRAKNLANHLNLDYYSIKKTRNETGVISSEITIDGFYNNIILIDDMIDSGKTIISAIENLENFTDRIYVCISHILKNESVNEIQSRFSKVKFINIDNYSSLYTKSHLLWQNPTYIIP